MRATIHWKTQQQSDRRTPPTGTGPHPYTAPMAFFTSTTEPTADEAIWSLVVQMLPGSTTYDWLAEVHFLVPEAPHPPPQPNLRPLRRPQLRRHRHPRREERGASV